LVSRVFYEASRDLGSQLPPRIDHVEACRPQGYMSAFILGAKAPGHERASRAAKRLDNEKRHGHEPLEDPIR
jgi:hypothetical protein